MGYRKFSKQHLKNSKRGRLRTSTSLKTLVFDRRRTDVLST